MGAVVTGVDKDLATLRDLKGRVLTEDEDVQFDSATNGVEAELSRWLAWSEEIGGRCIEALAERTPPADNPEPREGIVMVYDWEHRYLGCMGIERWQEVLAADSQEDKT